jgi:divalent metal cation (Fe/Co/Zn/Cd) transporter
MRIITGVTLIRASSRWSRFLVVVGSLRCHWTLSEVRAHHISTVDIFFFFFSLLQFSFLPISFWIGFLVSIVIFQQGLSIFKGAFREMTDASAPEPVLRSLSHSLDKLREDPQLVSSFLHVRGLRARRAGSHLFVNLHVGVPATLTAFELNRLEEQIAAALKAVRKDVKEVQVRFEVVSEKHGE